MRTKILVGAALTAVMLGTWPSSAAAATTYVAYYPMNEITGSIMTDRSAVGTNHGTRTAVILRQVHTGYGYGYRFNGTSSRVDVPNAKSLNPFSSSWRIGVSVKLPTTLAAGQYNVMQKGTSGTQGGFYKMEIRGGTSTKAIGQPRCTFKGSLGQINVASRRQITDGNWHRVACVKLADRVSIVVDNVTTTKMVTIGYIANTSRMTVGYKPTGSDWFIGSLDEIRVARTTTT